MLFKYLSASTIGIFLVYEILKQSHLKIQILYLAFMSVTMPAFIYYFIKGIEEFSVYIKKQKLMKDTKEEAEQIIYRARSEARDILAQVNKNAIQIEKEIEERKRHYHNFAVHANQTADYIAEVINECVVKNKNLIAINYSILQHLYNKAQASNQGKRAIRKFEKFRNQIMQIVEQNIIDPSLQERVKKEILMGISDKEIIRLEDIEDFLKGKRKSI